MGDVLSKEQRRAVRQARKLISHKSHLCKSDILAATADGKRCDVSSDFAVCFSVTGALARGFLNGKRNCDASNEIHKARELIQKLLPKGLFLWNILQREGLKGVHQLFDEALDLEPV